MYRSPLTWEEAKVWREELKSAGKKLVFTNGCFDIIHPGHVDLLDKSRNLGDALIVALNTDDSVSRIKGPSRPVNSEEDRVAVVSGLKAVDEVVLFDEDTPSEIINLLLPDILVKGGDWTPETVVGSDTVQQAGGRVEIIPLVEGRSTTNVIEKILNSAGIQGKDRLT